VDLELAAYDIRQHKTDIGYYATVTELPGCIAAAQTIDELDRLIVQAIWIYLDEHPEAPAYYRR
jgi:predicted RNase H-like HicB family nuclease